MKNRLYRILVKTTLKLHNLFYRLSACFAIKLEGGLHPKHRLMDYHKFFINNINKGERVLDIGCGNGSLSYDLAKKAEEVVGIDIEKKNIKTAQKNIQLQTLNILSATRQNTILMKNLMLLFFLMFWSTLKTELIF